MVGDHGQLHVARRRAFAVVFGGVALATVVMPVAALHGDDITAATEAARPEPRSHIQPVGEVASTIQPPPAADDAAVETFGLHVIRVPNLLRRHLGLGHGVGLVIARVTPRSAAEGWGFQANDVLVSIDDQSLIVPEQLAVLLQGTGASAARSCTLIRNGSRMTISLDSQARQQPEPTPPPAAASTPRPPVASTPAKEPAAIAPKRPLAPTASALALLPNKKQARSLATAAGTPPMTGLIRRKGDSALIQEDLDYKIEIRREDETNLVIIDGRGRQVFADAIETPEQRSRIPLAVRDRVEQLEKLLAQHVAAAREQPVAEIGRLDIAPIQVK